MCECNFSVYNYHLVLGPLFHVELSEISISAVSLIAMLKIITFWLLIKLELFFNSKRCSATEETADGKILKNGAQIEAGQNAIGHN